MNNMNELENVAYNLLYDHLHDWYREYVSEDDGDWDAKADKLAHKLSAGFEDDLTKSARGLMSFYLDTFKDMLP